jgi:putative oxidoreductase
MGVLRRLIFPEPIGGGAGFALMLLRVVVGLAFVHHGWGKIQHPMTWMGPDAPTPGALQALAAVAEFGGGLSWLVGLLVPLSSFGVLCTMSVALHHHIVTRGDPFVSSTGGPAFELAAVYWAVALLLLLAGPGRLSADAELFGRRR